MPYNPCYQYPSPSPPAPLPRGERGALFLLHLNVEAFRSPSPLAGEGLGERGKKPERGRSLPGIPHNRSSRKMTMHQRDFAKALRQNMTDAERLLWKHLRAHRYMGQKFRRQQPIGPYIVDFVHFGARLIVECDGGQHNENPADKRRDAWLQAQGFHVLRFWNHDILNRTESVLSTIFNILTPLSPRGRGDGGEGVKNNGPAPKPPNPTKPNR